MSGFIKKGKPKNGDRRNEGEKHNDATYGVTPVNPVVLTTGKVVKVNIPAIGKKVRFGSYKTTGVRERAIGGRKVYIKVVPLLVDARFQTCPSCKTPFFRNRKQIGYDRVECAKCGLTVQGTPNYVR